MNKKILAGVILFGFFCACSVSGAYALNINLSVGHRSSGIAGNLSFQQPLSPKSGLRIGSIFSGKESSSADKNSVRTLLHLDLYTQIGEFIKDNPATLALSYLSGSNLSDDTGFGASIRFANAFSNTSAFFELGIDISTGGGISTFQSAVRIMAMIGHTFNL